MKKFESWIVIKKETDSSVSFPREIFWLKEKEAIAFKRRLSRTGYRKKELFVQKVNIKPILEQ